MDIMGREERRDENNESAFARFKRTV
jgi:hypothetical protein